MASRLQPIMMIAGIPGAGKTTLARYLYAHFGGVIISTGDIARRVDPAGVHNGNLADEGLFRAAFDQTLFAALAPTIGNETPLVWLDGFPRNRQQMSYVDGEPKKGLLVVTCRPDIARDRQLRRGREGDTAEIVAKRTAEQAALLEVDTRGGWLYEAAHYGAIVNTDYKRPEQIADGFIRYLEGEKREAY